MNRRLTVIVALGVLAACLLGGYALGANLWSAQRTQITSQISDDSAFLKLLEKEKGRGPAVEQDLKGYVDRTLGGDDQIVDHRLRTRLNRIGEEVRLNGLSVSTGGQSTARGSPAAARFARRGMEKPLHEELDFKEVSGMISGEGTLGQALGLIHRIEAEPWIKRVTQVSLVPRDNGGKFNVVVHLTTLYLPDREPRSVESSSYDPSGFGRYAALVERNPFRLPPIVSAEVVTAPPRPAAPPASFPWGQWALTGIARGPDGPEVWLLNQSSGESRRLVVGEKLEQAVLIAAAGERAEFQLGQEKFSVMVGKQFDQRMPVKQE